MADWHLAPLAAYDCETTSADPDEARIVTATLVKIWPGPSVDILNWLVNPGVPISAEATAIHGITNERATEGIDPATAASQILAELDECWTSNRPVVIYNASFDLTVLDRELRRHCGIALPTPGVVIDPYTIDKHLDKYRRGSRTLAATCAHYQVKLEDAHTAEGDALAAARLAWRLAQVFRAELEELTVLNQLQARWREEWAVGFRQYLERQGKPEPVDGHWPVRPFVGAS